MSTELLTDRDYEYVAMDADSNVVHCYIVDKEKRATNPVGIFTKTSTNNYQTKLRVTGEESVIASNMTLANAKVLLIETLIANGTLPSIASDVDMPTSIVVTSDAEDDTVFIPVSGSTTAQLSAEVLPEGSTDTVVWTVQGAPVTGVSIDSNGLATFLSTTAVATATFVATSAVAGGVTGTIVITCTQV